MKKSILAMISLQQWIYTIIIILIIPFKMINATNINPNTVINSITPASTPQAIAITPDGSTAYVCTESNGISIIDMSTFTVTGTVSDPGSLLANPVGIAIAPPYGATGYILNLHSPSSSNILILDTSTNTITGAVFDPSNYIANASLLNQIAITPNGHTAYISITPSAVVILNALTNTITGRQTSGLNFPAGIAITPNGTTAYIANYSGNTVSILNVSSGLITGSVSSPNFNHPNTIAITPNGSTAYVTNSGNNTVSIIEVAGSTVTGTVSNPNFNNPDGIAITSDGTRAYVANAASTSTSSISIIDLTTIPATTAGYVYNDLINFSFAIATSSNSSYALAAGLNGIGLMAYTVPPGTLDTTFGSSGFTSTSVARYSDLRALAIQNTNEIVIAGTTQFAFPELFLARYTANGTLDTSFNSSGSTPGTQTLLVGTRTEANAMTVDASNNIIAAGFAYQSQTNMIVARFTSTGLTDTSFNGIGYNTLSIGTGATTTGVALQGSNIIVAGNAIVNGLSNFAIARFTSAGALDTANFNSPNGYVTTQAGIDSTIVSVMIDASNRIIVVGNVDNKITIARYTSTGVLDASFGTGGIFQPALGVSAIAYNAFLQGTDVVVVGTAYSSNTIQSLIVRCTTTPTVALDTTFNGTGYNLTQLGYGSQYYTGVNQTTQNNSIYYVTAGYDVGALDNQLALAEYLQTNGHLNTAAFGTNGYTLTTLGYNAYIKGLGLQPIPLGASGFNTIITGGITDGSFFVGRYGASIS